MQDDRDAARRGEALLRGREDAALADARPRLRPRPRADRAAGMAAHAGAAGSAPPTTCCGRPIPPTTTATASGPANRSQLRARALQRGTLVHRLLQSLPDIAAERRREAALGYLARNADGWSEAERDGAGRQGAGPDRGHRVSRRYSRPAAAPRSSIVGRLERPGRPPALVSGQIDRLVVTPDEVLIVDYKTNHAPPSQRGRGARRPMSASSRSTARCWRSFIPRQPVRAALLWTETPELMEISAPALDAALASVSSSGDRA